MQPGDVLRKFGTYRGLQIIGFCALWRSLGSPPLDELTARIREQFAEQGVQKSAAYRYVSQLREWAVELGRDPDRVDGLALEVARSFDDPEGDVSNIVEPVLE